jgi:heat-inducible transcriptional repressor
MEDLTQRQIDILNAIIKEYTQTGIPVGSAILEKKYKLGVSPATIRNEMVELAKKGYLKKEYFSSGRVPSAKAFRFYIKNLMKEKELSTIDEVSYKNSIWDDRDKLYRLFNQATRTLSRKTSLLSIAASDSGDFYYSGVANLFNHPEFTNFNLSRHLFYLLEEINFWEKIIEELEKSEEEIYYLLGEEDFHDPIFDQCASIFGEVEGKNIRGLIGVIGPKRMSYDQIIPQIKYFSHLISQILKEQGF